MECCCKTDVLAVFFRVKTLDPLYNRRDLRGLGYTSIKRQDSNINIDYPKIALLPVKINTPGFNNFLFL